MRMTFTKAIRDLRIRPGRTVLTTFALFLGIWGVGTVLVSYNILNKDLDLNFQKTSPAHLILESADFNHLDLEKFESKPEIESAEFRDFSVERIEVHANVWVPLFLYGLNDFQKVKVARIFSQGGPLVAEKGSIMVERDGKKISNIKAGSKPRLRIGRRVLRVPVKAICFDPAQAPSSQDHLIYAYADQKTFSDLTGKESGHRLIIRLNGLASQGDVARVSQGLISELESEGIHIDKVAQPLFNEHPHQWQLNTILFVVGIIGFLSFVMGSVLVAQLMRSIMSSQIKQIGIMKATGATRQQVFRIYALMLLLLGALSGIIAVPLATWAGSAYAQFVANILNFDIFSSVPASIYIFLILASLILPLLLSLPTLIKGTKISVKDALHDYGIQKEAKPLRLLNKLNLPNSFILAIRNSMRNSRRLMVTITTMALGVAIFSTGFNVRQSLWVLLTDLQNELRYDIQVILNQQILEEEAVSPFTSLENIKSIHGWSKDKGSFSSKSFFKQKEVKITALPYDTELFKPKLIAGNWLDNSTDLDVVINQKAWEASNYVPIGTQIELIIGKKRVEAKLSGVIEQLDLAHLYLNQSDYNRLFNPEGWVNTLTFVAERNDYESVLLLKEEIEKSILQTDLEVALVMSDVEKVKVIFDHLNIILSVIVFLSFLVLLVSAIGMASATSINISERTREIGVMRAIGASPKKIYAIFVSEGLLISGMSILIGLALSWPLSQLAAVFFGRLMLGEEAVLAYAFSPLGFFTTIGVTLVFGWLSSRIPAGNAVKLSTRDALAYG